MQIKGRAPIRAWMMAGPLLFALFVVFSIPATAWGQTSPDLTKIRFVVSHRSALLGSLPSYIAEDNGLFKKHGVAVEYISGSGGGSTLRLLSTGDVEMAEGGAPAAILAAKTDPNIELAGAWYHSAGVMVWIAPKSAHIDSPDDLAGAKLGYSRAGSASQWLSQESVKRAGIDNVSFVSVGGMGDNWVAAKSGVITAGWAMEPFLSDKLHHDNAQVVLDPSHYIKHFYLEGIAVNKEFAQQHPQAIRGVFEALYEAVEFIQAHPDQAAEIGTKHFRASKEVLMSGIRNYLDNDVWDMKVDPQGFETVMKGMLATGQLEEKVDIGKLLNQSYLPEKLRTPFK